MSLLAEETIAWPWRSPQPSPRPPRRARRRSSGPPSAAPLRLGESHRRERTVRCRVFIHPKPALTGPLGLAAGSAGKVQLAVGFGGVGSGAGRNKQLAPFFFKPGEIEVYLYQQRMCGIQLLFRLQKSPLFRVLSAFLPVYKALGASCQDFSFCGLVTPTPHRQDFLFSWGGRRAYWSLAPDAT